MAPRPRLTHFLCLPLVNPSSRPELERSLNTFTEAVVAREECDFFNNVQSPKTLPRQIVRPVGTLHLTLGVMSLPTPEAIFAAIDELETLDLASLIQEPLTVHLKGLVPFIHAGRNVASVLSATPNDQTGRLQPFAQALRARFEAAGHILPDERGLTLHATVVNTRYLSSRRPMRRVFDPTALIEAWGDTEWGSVTLNRVAICEMGAKKEYDTESKRYVNERYHEVASVRLPT